MSALHQISVTYDAGEDRLLMRVSTDDRLEFRLWLTRRALKLLWPVLLKLLELDPSVRSHGDAGTRQAVMGFRQEQSLRQGDFSRPFEAGNLTRPLGDAPFLMARCTARQVEPGQFSIELAPASGQGITLGLNAEMLHIVAWLLSQRAAEAEWDLGLVMPSSATLGDRPAVTH